MASIIFQEVDLLKKLEILKGQFEDLPNFSHSVIPKLFEEIDKSSSNELTVDNI